MQTGAASEPWMAPQQLLTWGTEEVNMHMVPLAKEKQTKKIYNIFGIKKTQTPFFLSIL